MKKLTTVFAGIFLLLITINSNAQSKTGAAYFTGKWSVVIKGTPNGDAKMFILLNKSDTTLSGTVHDSTGAEMSKIDKVELAGDKATVYFNTQGYDVNLEMDKKRRRSYYRKHDGYV